MDTLLLKKNNTDYRFCRSRFLPVESNMYVLVEGSEAIVVDAVRDNEMIGFLQNSGVKRIHLFLTHEHYDHTHGISSLKNNFETAIYCHRKCSEGLSTEKRSSPRLVAYIISVKDMNDGGHRYEDFKDSFEKYAYTADCVFDVSTAFNVTGHLIRTLSVPGHTPGSSLYILDDTFVFSGDSLIKGNKIISSFRGGNKDDLMNVTLPLLKSLPDNLIIMPGHGEPFRKGEFDFTIYDV